MLLGWMSRRVLGQYDLLVTDDPGDADADRDGDIVYLVGPNLAALEQRFGFPPDEFRTWVLLHELHPPRPVHRRAVDARATSLGLVDERCSMADVEPGRSCWARCAAVRAEPPDEAPPAAARERHRRP